MTAPVNRGAIPPFLVMEVMRAADARAAAGDDVFHLEVGQPSTAAPQGVLDAAKAADKQAITWSVQIGAFSRPDYAQRHLAKLAGVLPDLMRKAKVTIETVTNSRTLTYRARLHGLNERQAHDLCRRIRNVKFDCLTIAPAEASLAAGNYHG